MITKKINSKGLGSGRSFRINKATQISELLKFIGVSNINGSYFTKGRVWQQKPEVLWNFLELARNIYFSKIKQLRPDLGENHEECVALNAAWSEIKRKFAKKGFVLEN